MEIAIFDHQSDLLTSPSKVSAIAQQVVLLEQQHYDEVSIHFVTPQVISDLHAQFFDDPSVTDCLSFPIDTPEEQGQGRRVLGDVFVCPAAAIRYATLHNINPYVETTLYLVHGLLHLLGYDDTTKEKRVAMRAAEKRHMKELERLEIADCRLMNYE